MTKARDTANIVGGGFSGTIAGATMEPTGDTAAGDNAAIGFTAAEGLILTGQGSTNDVTIKNDADADVIEIPTGTVNVTMAGTLGVTGVITGGGLVVPDGSIAVADLDIDGGTDIGAALVDADLMIVDDGAGGTNRKATMTRLATYMGTKIGGLKEFIVSSGSISDAATQAFTQFDSSKYVHYEFEFRNVIPVDDNAINKHKDDKINIALYMVFLKNKVLIRDAEKIDVKYLAASEASEKLPLILGAIPNKMAIITT